MKKIKLLLLSCLPFLCAFIFPSTAFSQDDIVMLNNDVVKGKVEEVGVDLIRYRKADNMDGPIYDLSKANVYMIIYANGSRDVINNRQGDGMQQQGQMQSQTDDIPAPTQVREAPPEMPAYQQPPCPYEGYLWVPGYWGWSSMGGYYWVPGVWMMPPRHHYYWTPGYWGYDGNYFGWHEGYWGEHVGYYGGVNYGCGYGGSGYEGGRWEGDQFRYNTAVTVVDVTVVHTTYVDRTVVRENNIVVNRSSYNGAGGVQARPSENERRYENENHVTPTVEQRTHIVAARSDKSQYVTTNGGKPNVIAMNKPGGEHFTQEGHVTAAHPNTQPQPEHNQVNQQHPNGNMQQQQHPNNTMQPEHPNGNTQQPHPNNTVQPEHPNGNTQQSHPENNLQQEHPKENNQGGNSQQQHPNTNTQQEHQPANGQGHQNNMQQPKQQQAKPKPQPKPASKPAPKPVTKEPEKK